MAWVGNAHYPSMRSMEKIALEEPLLRAIPDVQRDSSTQETKKMIASQPVNFFKTSAVEVPKRESPPSPPKEAPSPVLLLSWIKITKHKIKQRTIKRVIAVKYKNVIIMLPIKFLSF
jgi:hypothetical protein